MIRVGILGTARIARALFEHPLKGANIVAVASRDVAKAAAFAAEYGIPKSFGSYEELLKSRDVDAVYIPLPQHLHCEYVVRAANAQKHVLVEKPAALSVHELHRMLEACEMNHVVYMEAFMYRFMRIHNRTKEILSNGTIGRLRYIDYNFCFNAYARGFSGFRLDRNLGGGVLYDLGVYGVDFLRFMTDGEPNLRSAYMRRRDSNGIDEFIHGVYTVGDVVATMTCAYDSDANYYALSGEFGAVHVPVALSGRSVANVLRIHLLDGDRRYDEHFPAENPYESEVEYFAQCITENKRPFLDGENSIRNMQLIEQLFATATVL